MKAADFDKKFDEGEEDLIDGLDLSKMKRPGHQLISLLQPLYSRGDELT